MSSQKPLLFSNVLNIQNNNGTNVVDNATEKLDSVRKKYEKMFEDKRYNETFPDISLGSFFCCFRVNCLQFNNKNKGESWLIDQIIDLAQKHLKCDDIKIQFKNWQVIIGKISALSGCYSSKKTRPEAWFSKETELLEEIYTGLFQYLEIQLAQNRQKQTTEKKDEDIKEQLENVIFPIDESVFQRRRVNTTNNNYNVRADEKIEKKNEEESKNEENEVDVNNNQNDNINNNYKRNLQIIEENSEEESKNEEDKVDVNNKNNKEDEEKDIDNNKKNGEIKEDKQIYSLLDKNMNINEDVQEHNNINDDVVNDNELDVINLPVDENEQNNEKNNNIVNQHQNENNENNNNNEQNNINQNNSVRHIEQQVIDPNINRENQQQHQIQVQQQVPKRKWYYYLNPFNWFKSCCEEPRVMENDRPRRTTHHTTNINNGLE